MTTEAEQKEAAWPYLAWAAVFFLVGMTLVFFGTLWVRNIPRPHEVDFAKDLAGHAALFWNFITLMAALLTTLAGVIVFAVGFGAIGEFNRARN